MLANLALLALALAPAYDPRSAPGLWDYFWAPAGYRPRIELWTNHGDAVYSRGQRVRVYFRLDQDAYVTIVRVDTDGRVRVLFPREPWEDNFARGGREYEVEHYASREAFRIDDYPGVGYVFAVASADPFVYDPIETDDRWDYRVIADGRVRGDPYVALTELAERIVPEGYSDWDYDIHPYHVERRYDYPRFLCYDCHSYVGWSYWDPYYHSCVRFRIVIYDDPWYYPYRYYGGTRVVFVRPYRPEPRFIFKDRASSSDRFVTVVRGRPANDETRRGVRGRDRGGIGVIPPPRSRDRREPPDDDRDRGDHRKRPDRPDRSDGQDRRDRRGGSEIREPAPRPERPEPRRTPVTEPAREGPPAPRAEPQRAEPRRERAEAARAEPRRAEASRAEPRHESPPPPRAEPRRAEAPRAEPRRDPPPASKEKPRQEPELRRRKP